MPPLYLDEYLHMSDIEVTVSTRRKHEPEWFTTVWEVLVVMEGGKD